MAPSIKRSAPRRRVRRYLRGMTDVIPCSTITPTRLRPAIFTQLDPHSPLDRSSTIERTGLWSAAYSFSPSFDCSQRSLSDVDLDRCATPPETKDRILSEPAFVKEDFRRLEDLDGELDRSPRNMRSKPYPSVDRGKGRLKGLTPRFGIKLAQSVPQSFSPFRYAGTDGRAGSCKIVK